jgi:abortive infection bacteriophage resistance protein
MTVYNKPPLTSAEHIVQWRNRGLAVPDPLRAEHYLSVISYYRLSAYSLPFQAGNPDHHFRPGVSFDHILDLYVFDRELRLLVLDAIERIEVAIRAQLSNYMSLQYGGHWYLDRGRFDRKYDHNALLDAIEQECRRSKETFVRHYRTKYTAPSLPPSWVVTEMLTYGQLSKVYDNLAAFKDQKAIARCFDTTAELLCSWMQSISYLRNVCAHHMRLWNRELGNAPKVPKHQTNWIMRPVMLADTTVDPNKRLYLALAVIESLLRVVNPESTWHWRLKKLMDRYPAVSRAHMGMPNNWADDPFWRFDGQEPLVHS